LQPIIQNIHLAQLQADTGNDNDELQKTIPYLQQPRTKDRKNRTKQQCSGKTCFAIIPDCAGENYAARVGEYLRINPLKLNSSNCYILP